MKHQDLEEQMRRQPFRDVPSDWRASIIAAAARSAPLPDGPRSEERGPRTSRRFWQELLWPAPAAWAGLAALWLLIAVFNYGSSVELFRFGRRALEPSLDHVRLWREQRGLFVELLDLKPPERRDPAPTRPRTARTPEYPRV